MDKQVAFSHPGQLSVRRLLQILLQDYDFRLIEMGGRKLLIQVDHVLVYDLTGSVRESGSGERLFGVSVRVTDSEGRSTYAVTDANGLFNLSVRRGPCHLTLSYIGYLPIEQRLDIDRDRLLNLLMQPQVYAIKSVDVKRRKSMEELDETAPSNLIAFSNADLFSQIRLLPSVSVSNTNMSFHVAGGSADENLFLLDDTPIYSPQHFNSMQAPFNGDAVKSVSFHSGYIPTQYEGRLSSVTNVRLKDGNKQRFEHTLSFDMPSVSLVSEGPVIKDKLSYLASLRRSWLDLFDDFLRPEDRTNLTAYDYNLKLDYEIDSLTTIKASAYNSNEDFHLSPDDEEIFTDNSKKHSVLHGNNQLYTLSLNTLLSPQFTLRGNIAYSRYTSRANARDFGIAGTDIIRSRISTMSSHIDCAYTPGALYTAHFGIRGAWEKYILGGVFTAPEATEEAVRQLSLYYDSRIRLTPELYIQVGLNYVFYHPRHNKEFHSVQPRFSMKYALADNDLLYGSVSRMEQFFHHVMLTEITMPFDFLMPSIGGFRPSYSTHYEVGWKHYFRSGIMEVSAYYKQRESVLSFRPWPNENGSTWADYIMEGNGDSHGASFYFYNQWHRLGWQLSYTLSKSREWYAALPLRGKMPSLYDIPHNLNSVVSYRMGHHSTVALGGTLRSGRVLGDDDLDIPMTPSTFRTSRDHMRYHIDMSYTFQRKYRLGNFLMRFGLYNVLGNPSEEEMLYFFSVQTKKHCVPYATVTFKF